MFIRIISNVQSFALGCIQPFIKLLHEDNNDDEGKCNDLLYKLSFSSNPSCDSSESNSPTTNIFGVIAKSSFSLSRPLVMKVICGCIQALPLPVKSFIVTSIDQLKPLVESIASSGILDGLVKDDTLPRLTLPTETCLVATSSELVVASSTDLVTNDRATLVEIVDEETYFPNALNFVVIGCLIILLAFGCGVIRSDTAILCLGIFQAVILEYSYQMISSFVAVLMKSLIVIFTSPSYADSADKDEAAEGKELAVSTLQSSSLRLDMPASAASNELIVPIDVTAAIVDRSDSSDVSIDMPYKSCLVSFLLLIFTSLVEIVDMLSVVPCLVPFLSIVFTSLIEIVGTLSVIDWLILLTLVGSISTASSKQPVLGSDVETTINTSVSSASSDDIDTSLALRCAATIRACLSSGLQHVQHKRHDLLVAFLLMACAPIPVMVAVMMLLLDFWTVIQSLVVATCLIYATTYISKALQSIPTRLRGSTAALVGRVYQLNQFNPNPITTMGNIITDCLLTLLLMVLVPLMGIVVIMMMLILASFNWSAVLQVLAECTMMLLSTLPSITQACGVVMLMMCLRIVTYYLLRIWQYQLSIAFTFLDMIGASSPLVNRMRWLFAVISFALTYYDDGGGGVHITRGGILYTTTRTLNSIWMILAWVMKKFIYLICYTTILLIYLFFMAVQSIDYKAVMYTSVTCLIRLPISIVWRFLGRLTVALFGCIVYLYTGIKLLVLAPFHQVEQKEEPLTPPVAVAVSDDEDSDDDSLIDFGAAADLIDDCVGIDQDVPLFPPPPPKRRSRRRRKVYPPAVWHRGRGGRGGRLRPRPPKPG